MNRCRTECCALPLLAVALRYRETKRLLLLGVGFFFEPEGRGFESLPACQWNQGGRRFFEIAFLGLGRFGPSGRDLNLDGPMSDVEARDKSNVFMMRLHSAHAFHRPFGFCDNAGSYF